MPTTLNPTCPLCGLRYTDRPLLDLHIREDHRRRDDRPEPDPGDSGDTRTSPPRARALSPLHSLPTELFPATRDVTAAPAERREVTAAPRGASAARPASGLGQDGPAPGGLGAAVRRRRANAFLRGTVPGEAGEWRWQRGCCWWRTSVSSANSSGRTWNGPDTALSTGSGAKAITLAASAAPDLVVLDLGLPDVSGETVAREVRASGPVPILMLTAKAAEEDRIAGLELGADDYVTKPFSPRELVLRVQAILRRGRPSTRPKAVARRRDLVIDEPRRE